MKRSSIIILLTMLMSMVCTKASAYDISAKNADGVELYYSKKNNTDLEVSGTNKDSKDFSGILVIPELVEYNGITYNVTSIGEQAFYKNGGLISVIIPKTVTSIGAGSFADCSNLISINIPKNVTYIGLNAFRGCSIDKVIIEDVSAWCNIQLGVVTDVDTYYDYSNYLANPLNNSNHLYIDENTEITTLEIPDGITEISAGLFYGCAGIKEVKIPSSLKKIGSHAFANCSGLTSIIIPNNVTQFVNNTTFKNCNSLTYVELHCKDTPSFSGNTSIKTLILGEEVKEIQGNAFSGCTGLTSIDIPNSVTSIGGNAFANCTGITSISIPNSVTSIGIAAFSGCTNLSFVSLLNSSTSIGNNAFSGTAWYNNQSDGIIYLGKIAYKFKGTMPENAEIIIKEGTEKISAGIFSDCSNPFSVKIPSSMTAIGDQTFNNCKGLTSINIPNGVTSIGNSAFSYCSGLTSIIIPNSVTSIGSSAFEYCSGLTSVTIPNSVTSIGQWAFQSCNVLTSVHITDLEAWCKIHIGSDPFSCAHHLFLNGEEITNLIIPSSVTSINSSAFSGCSGLTSVTIPSSVTSINSSAFSGCSGLTSVTIPSSVTSIGYNAFSGCTELISINIPNSVKRIDSFAFSECTGLTSFEIPNRVTSINEFTFQGCSGLKTLTIPQSVTSIGSAAFSGCSGLTTITIPNSVTFIGSGAFSGCSGLTSITIPNSVTSIGSGAFSGCSGLITASISNNMTKIPAALFRDCTNLKTVYLGKSATEVEYPDGGEKGGNPFGWNPFRGCNNLQNVIIGSDKFPHMIDYNYFTNIDNCRFIMKQSTYDSGIPNSNQKYIKYIATYSKQPMVIELKSKGATSAVFNLCPIDEDGYFDEDNMKTVRTTGLTPGEQLSWKLDEENYGILSDKANETVTLTVEEPKALSTTKARLLATAEEADDMEHFGFEWRRIDSSDLVKSKVVSSPLFNGTIVGTLNNLNPEVEYKYRPFYKSDNGEMFYGEWMGLFTGDADVFFEPEVYTKDAADITKVSALLAGVWFEGTDDFQEKGFEYWTVTGSKTRGVGSDAKKVVVSGNAMTATLEGLKAGATYGYRSYVKTTSGSTTYGEEKTFQTILIGDVDGDGKLTNADADAIAKHIIGQTPSGFNKKMADVNDDGDVNVIDIVLLVKMIE